MTRRHRIRHGSIKASRSPGRKNANRRNPFVFRYESSASRRKSRWWKKVAKGDRRDCRENIAPRQRDASSSVGLYRAQIYRTGKFLPETAWICDAYRRTETLKISDVGTDGSARRRPKIEARYRDTRQVRRAALPLPHRHAEHPEREIRETLLVLTWNEIFNPFLVQ